MSSLAEYLRSTIPSALSGAALTEWSGIENKLSGGYGLEEAVGGEITSEDLRYALAAYTAEYINLI